jgi:hypothetical protein
LPNWDISRGFLYIYIINFPESISEAAMGGAGTLYIIHNLGAQWKDTELPEFLCCRMICNLPPPPTQVSVGELYIQGIERQRGGEPFSTGKAVGGPKSYDSTETACGTPYYGTPYNLNILYSL